MDLISKQRDFLCNRAQKTAKMNSAWLHWRLFFWSASPQKNQFALEIHYTLPPFFIEIFFPMPKEDYFRFHERFFATGADSWEFSSFFIYHFWYALNQSYLDYLSQKSIDHLLYLLLILSYLLLFSFLFANYIFLWHTSVQILFLFDFHGWN